MNVRGVYNNTFPQAKKYRLPPRKLPKNIKSITENNNEENAWNPVSNLGSKKSMTHTTKSFTGGISRFPLPSRSVGKRFIEE